MATLTIGDKVQAPEPNTYTLNITTYAGDADYYETLTINGFRRVEDAELLDELLELLPALQAAYPDGRGDKLIIPNEAVLEENLEDYESEERIADATPVVSRVLELEQQKNFAY